MLTFLHLSDLHLTTADAGTQFDLDLKIREALLRDLGIEGRTKFDAILVTGDITYNGRADEFVRAKEWFEEVRRATDSSPEAIFVVPGNHDVNRSTVSRDSSLWELHQALRKEELPEEQRLISLQKKLQDPFDFLTAMAEYRTFAAEHGCPTSPKELAWVQVLDGSRHLEDGTRVRFHGLNSALISDQQDGKGNLLLSEMQFQHFDNKPQYVDVVLCHHPHPWLIDGNRANDFFRTQAHVVLCGHDHDPKCYIEGRSLRVFAGAVHPNRRTRWEPCYHVIRLAINREVNRDLIVDVETRVWRNRDNSFVPYPQADGKFRHQERIALAAWTVPIAAAEAISCSPIDESGLSFSGETVTNLSTNELFIAARRKLIVHFFRLGILSRYQAAIDAGVWDDSDDAFEGQERWSRVFERAERAGHLSALWKAVAEKDETLIGQSNPFDSVSSRS